MDSSFFFLNIENDLLKLASNVPKSKMNRKAIQEACVKSENWFAVLPIGGIYKVSVQRTWWSVIQKNLIRI